MLLVQRCSGFVGVSLSLKNGAYVSITWMVKAPLVHVLPG